MSEGDPTYIGRVRHVLGAQITIALDPGLAGVAPIYRGRLQPIGQIGSLVRIPQGLVDLVAAVTLIGIAELTEPQPPVDTIQTGERWLQTQLLGEIHRGTDDFQRGVGSYPGLDDPAHFATAEELTNVFPPPGSEHLRLGALSSAEGVPLALHAERLVTRHAAVIGSTGAGKTSAVAKLVQGFARDGWSAANIIVIDPHNEYAHALGEDAATRSVLASGDHKLRVPYWALPATEILRVFAGSTGSATTGKRILELVTEARREFVSSADWLQLDPETVTADTPVPFDLKVVWHRLDEENRKTVNDDADRTPARVDTGDPAGLRPATFSAHGPGSQPPNRGEYYGVHGRIPELLRLGLLDPRLKFFQEPEGTTQGPDPLMPALHEWMGHTKPVSVLDFSGVPSDATELAIGVVMQLLFEVALRGTKDAGIGRAKPVLIILEEAHRYLGDEATPIAREAANRIAREGRKYGVGLVLVTQRPSELPETTLAQSGTLITLRLTNSADQAKIRHALPDSVAGLAAALPALRTGEAIVSGESLVLPARTLIDRPDPQPLAEDPSLESWRVEPFLPDLAPAIAAWRGTKEDADDT